MAKHGIEYMLSRERRVLDVVLASGMLLGGVALSPLLVPAAMVASRSMWPFYHDTRGIAGSEPFEMYKFQTMPPKRLGVVRAITGRRHPEAGRVGNVLRLGPDELPQAVHILSGKMSAVGPRPLLPVVEAHQKALGGPRYDEWTALVQQAHIRPGEFGPSQLYRRGHPEDAGDHATRTSLEIDLRYYAERTTMARDWLLITRSVAALTHLSSTPPEAIVERLLEALPPGA